MLASTEALLENLFERYACLHDQKNVIRAAFDMLYRCFAQGNTLYLCGNGGSAADAEHIVGELMKSFVKDRRISAVLEHALAEKYPQEADFFIHNLQGSLPVHSLTSNNILMTAYMNDVCPEMLYAQQVTGYMRRGDVLWCITTSGKSKNIINALKMADAMGMDTLVLTGAVCEEIKQISKITITMPETETYKIQELHLPVYHMICLMLENEFF